MIVNINTTEEEIATWLRNQGFEARVVSQYNDTEDGEIEINANLHIQVGKGYVCLVRIIRGSFEYLYDGISMDDLLAKLKAT